MPDEIDLTAELDEAEVIVMGGDTETAKSVRNEEEADDGQ